MHSHKKIFLGHLAQSRGLFGDMLVAIATAFGQLLALDTDNVKHLQVNNIKNIVSIRVTFKMKD